MGAGHEDESGRGRKNTTQLNFWGRVTTFHCFHKSHITPHLLPSEEGMGKYGCDRRQDSSWASAVGGGKFQQGLVVEGQWPTEGIDFILAKST